MSKVLFFSDVDGVWHIPDHLRVDNVGNFVVPFSKEWKTSVDYSRTDLLRTVDAHYAVTHSVQLAGNDWFFNWSQDMLDEIHEMIRTGDIHFVWLTNWRHHAVNILNPLFGFDETISFLPWELTDNHDMKAPALDAYYAGLDASERKPFIWVDDKANSDYVPGALKGNYFQEKYGIDCLIIQTDPNFGLTKEDIFKIKNFVASY